MRLIAELRRRRVFRTAAIYIVGAWLVMQVADVSFPALDIPERAIRYVLIAAAAGFPVALIFGWFYDIGAHGVQRTAPANSGDVAEPLGRSDYLILSALTIVVVAIVYSALGNVVDTPAPEYSRAGDGPPMVAVLPFMSNSSLGESDSFASGVHDDLLTQLSKLQSIRVISRTSVMEYRDTVRNIREIGAALGADAILEGGVQGAGDRIRINAQLIDSRTDEHLWAETYDRELTLENIFEVQSEIARAITTALSATLTDQDSATLVTIPTDNMAAYRAYHDGMELLATHGFDGAEVHRLFEEAVALDPGFTRAWAELVGVLSLGSFGGGDPAHARRAEEAIAAIQSIAPNSADLVLAKTYFTYYILRDYDLALKLVLQAQEMVPSDSRLLQIKAWILRRMGDFRGWADAHQEALVLDPLDHDRIGGAAQTLILSHRYREAQELLDSHELDTPRLSIFRELLLLREDRDLIRLANAYEALIPELPPQYQAYDHWEVHVARRELQSAEMWLAEMPGDASEPGRQGDFVDKLDWAIQTYWMLDKQPELAASNEQLLGAVERRASAEHYVENGDSNLYRALVFATTGNRDAAVEQVNNWRRLANQDFAGMIVSQHRACRILGIAGAALETIACMRHALETPSWMFPYWELMLPFYDSMRDDPEFIELLADIDAGKYSY